MGFRLNLLWAAPELNPVTRKARSIPILNPFDPYGRVFHFAWLGYFMCFWSWYAFPPLLTKTIKEDLHLSHNEIANSNILSLTATLLTRLCAGAACDWVGPRWTMALLLLAGAVPTALAGTVNSAAGLVILRCFVGIIGAAFIPCQVWTTGFFDKNVVGTANALTAGFGNGGIGITYFVMPAILDSLVNRRHLTPHVAWRVAFVVPFVLIVAVALGIIFVCPDTPTGKWTSRALAMQRCIDTQETYLHPMGERKTKVSTESSQAVMQKKRFTQEIHEFHDDVRTDEDDMLSAASWELVKKPSWNEVVKVALSLPTLSGAVAIFCTFGSELCVASFLGAYYNQKFPSLGQTGSGGWAAMYGLLNFAFRPIGGVLSDSLYRWTGSLWSKKVLISTLGVSVGLFMVVIGVLDPDSKALMMGLMTGLAFFTEAGSGSIFSLTPHVHPTSNGIITGITGAAADLGGLVYLLIARYDGVSYAKIFLTVGAINIGGHLAVSWIRPIPKEQIGGR